MTPAPHLSVGTVFAEMKERVVEHQTLVIRLTLSFALLSAVITIPQSSGSGISLAIGWGLSIFLGVAYAGMIAQLFCLQNKAETASHLWQSINPVLARLIWVSLVAGVGIAIGLILFIVPGLLLLTIWAVALPVIVVERLGVLESLGRSRELVKGNGWRVLAVLLILGLLAIIATVMAILISTPLGTGIAGSAVASFLGSMVVNPLSAIGPAALYNVLTIDGHDQSQESDLLRDPSDPPTHS